MKIVLTETEVADLVRVRYGLDSSVVVIVQRARRNHIQRGKAVSEFMKPLHQFFNDSLVVQPDQKIAAIKALREMCPGLGLAAAKYTVEAFADFYKKLYQFGLPTVEGGHFVWYDKSGARLDSMNPY